MRYCFKRNQCHSDRFKEKSFMRNREVLCHSARFWWMKLQPGNRSQFSQKQIGRMWEVNTNHRCMKLWEVYKTLPVERRMKKLELSTVTEMKRLHENSLPAYKILLLYQNTDHFSSMPSRNSTRKFLVCKDIRY